jgi:hypothetical protein
MGVVYLGDECIGEMYTSYIPNITTTVINVLKKPSSRYIVDENGVVKRIEGDITGVFDDALTIGRFGLYNAFYACIGVTGSVSFPKLTSVGDAGLDSAFYSCTGLTGSVSFPNLTSIGAYGLRAIFDTCTGITGSVSFPSLTSIGDNGLSNAFYGCTKLTGSVSFPELTSIGNYGLYYAFRGCTGLTGSVSFPKLTTLGATFPLDDAFYGCTKITEIHFRADMQATIEAQNDYSSKFGATNATIYFDL